MVLCVIGFAFFVTSLTLVFCYSGTVKEILKAKYKIGEVANATSTTAKDSQSPKTEAEAQIEANEHLNVFYAICIFNALAYVLVFIQLFVTKPKSKKVIIPLILVTSVTFIMLIAIDFYLEIQMTHTTFKDSYMQSSKESPKKGKAKFKTGYLMIYGELLLIWV